MAETGYIDFEKQASPSGGASASTGDRHVREVRDFCALWSRAVKTICLYPASNPLPDEFRGKFFDALTVLLEDCGQITLQTFDGGFKFDGQIVYESSVGEENLAYLYFKDGIRELSFEIGVTRQETDSFLDIGAQALSATGQSVDTANRMWEAGLAHIRHFAVDRIIEGAYIEAAGNEQLAQTHERFVSPTADEITKSTATPPEAYSPYVGVQRERHLHVLKFFGDVSALTMSEKSEINSLCRPETADDSETLGLDILFEIIRTGEGQRIADEAIEVVEQQFEQAVTGNRWDLARKLLIEVRGAMAQAQPRLAQRFGTALTRMADKKNFERLTQHLNANPQINLEPIRDLLSLFGGAAITSITAMLGTLEHRPARMMICDFLIANGRETVDLIGGFIYDKRWYVSRNVAMILGEIGNERGLSFLKKSAAHTDARVRLETLRAAKRIIGPEAERILRGFLNDPDADLRKRALRALGERHSTAVLEEIKLQLNPDTLPDRDLTEVQELLKTYARLGGAAAAKNLAGLARRSPWLKRARWQPVRLAAIRALGASPDPAARRELEALATDRAREVAESAKLALQYCKSGGEEKASEDDEE